MNSKIDSFDIGFDKQIPENVKNELRRFVNWVESNYEMPITLWVDFEYRHYLVSRKKKRVGFLFYWDDDLSQMPVLRLPVRTEKSTMEEILGSFAEGLDMYFTWIKGEMHEEYKADEQWVDSVLNKYAQSNKLG